MTIKDPIIIREYKDQDKESVLNLLRLNTPNFFSSDEESHFAYYLENEIEYYFTIELTNNKTLLS